MDCREIDKLLSEYIDGALTPGLSESVKLHLSRCGKCSRALKQLESVLGSLKEIDDEEVPENFYAGLDKKLEAADLPWWRRAAAFLTLRTASLIAAGAVCGVVLGLVLASPSAKNKAARPVQPKDYSHMIIKTKDLASANSKIEQIKKKMGKDQASGGTEAKIVPKRYVITVNNEQDLDELVRELKEAGCAPEYGVSTEERSRLQGFPASAGSLRRMTIDLELQEEMGEGGRKK
jgi:hypothetical protein